MKGLNQQNVHTLLTMQLRSANRSKCLSTMHVTHGQHKMPGEMENRVAG